MASDIKTWMQLGLGTAMSLGTLSVGCAPADQAEAPAAPPHSAPSSPVPAPVATGGEGEGGVSMAQAATDPVIFLSVLAITEAHIIAARDAHAAGRDKAAAEMFAHPVSEVLADAEPIFQDRGVEPFNQLLLDASSAIYDGETPDQIAARADEIFAALRRAALKAPDNGRGAASIQAGVIADQIDRAADMYAVAQQSDQYEPYLDGYGFYQTAQVLYEAEKPRLDAELPGVISQIDMAMTMLDMAYPGADRPDTLGTSASALKAASSQVQLHLK